MQQASGLVSASQEEQAKIIAQISKEESFGSIQIARLSEDAIFIEDNPAKILQKLLALNKCPMKERLAYTKHLGELMPQLGDEGIKNLKAILDILLEETDEIKRALITQLPQICSVLEKRVTGYQEIKDCVIGALQKLLESPNIDIKEEAGNEIARVAPFLSEDDRGILILTKVIFMAHDELHEENKIVAVQLFGKLSSIFGQQLTESFIASEILSMGEDVKQRVRKEAVLQIARVGQVVTPNFFKTKLLKFYFKKCEEKTWQTRKSCVDVIVEISKLCPMPIREQEISGKMIIFLQDESKWVKTAAYKNLGPFIATLEGSLNLNEKLLDFYLKMNDPDVKDLGIDKEILQVCSFNFPAVLNTFGPSKWPQMSKLFQQLLKNTDKRIKKPLACSLHELAHILGPQRSEKELLSVLDLILKDANDEIKFGMIQNLWKFIRVFEQERRENLLDVFVLLQRDQKKWRIRELIARQITDLAKTFNADIVFRIILPISLKLCNDVVSIVRRQAAKQMYGIIEVLDNDDYKMCAVENIKGFANSNKFNQRQSFVIMCGNLMNLRDGIFEKEFLADFEILAKDPVKNVRMLVGQVLLKHLKKNGRLCGHPKILEIISHFESDHYISKSLLLKFPKSEPKEYEAPVNEVVTPFEEPKETEQKDIEANKVEPEETKNQEPEVQQQEVQPQVQEETQHFENEQTADESIITETSENPEAALLQEN